MTFWNELLKRSCSHRFTWPRVDADGCHYQICLLCGTAYEYDWKMMRRTGRLALNAELLSRPCYPKAPSKPRTSVGGSGSA